MLIRVPDEYAAFLDHLKRNGIKYELIEECQYKKALSRRAETLNEIGLIDLNKIDKNVLLNKAIEYIDNKIQANQNTLEYLYNESLVRVYSKLTE
jgi:hypothetical protein